MQQYGQARKLGQPELGADVHGAERQHSWRERSNAKSRHHCRGDRRDATADEDFRPGDAGRIEELPCEHPDAAGFRHRGDWQGLARTMVPARGGEPPEFLLREELTVVSPGVQPHDHGVELSPVVALQQITRRPDSDLDQQLRVLRIHARDQSGQLRPRDVVADADCEPPFDGLDAGERAIVRRNEPM